VSFELHPDLKRDGIPLGRFPLCLVLLINDRNYPWFVLVPERENIRDTVDLAPGDYRDLWSESREFGPGIMRAWDGDKLNVAALGNVTPQLHVHHVVRYKTDAAWPAPIWGKHPMLPYDENGIRQIMQRIRGANIVGLDLFGDSKVR